MHAKCAGVALYALLHTETYSLHAYACVFRPHAACTCMQNASSVCKSGEGRRIQVPGSGRAACMRMAKARQDSRMRQSDSDAANNSDTADDSDTANNSDTADDSDTVHGGASSASEPHRASGRADDSDKADASDRTDNSDIANDSDTADDTDMTRILPRPLPRRVRYRRTGR